MGRFSGFLTGLAAAFVVSVCLGVEQAEALSRRASVSETTTQTLALPSGGTVTVETTNGDVEVMAWDRGEVELTVVKRVGKVKSEEAKPYLDEIVIEVKERPDGLMVVARHPNGRRKANYAADLTLRVPASASTTARTTNGSIDVEGLTGPVNLKTTNGSIDADRLTGPVAAKTTNGNVSIKGRTGRVNAETTNGSVEASIEGTGELQGVACRTVNGNVKLELPEGASFDLDAGTVNGHVETGFGVLVSGKLTKKRMRGTVGGGGPTVKAESVNGNVKVRPRK